jgi:hypothetical protein
MIGLKENASAFESLRAFGIRNALSAPWLLFRILVARLTEPACPHRTVSGPAKYKVPRVQAACLAITF